MPTTLLTGATGFIGSHLARALVDRGDHVRITVRDASDTRQLAGLQLEAVDCDVLDPRAVRKALKGVDRVFHAAGMTSVRPADADRLFEVNVGGTTVVMEECLRAGVDRVVLTSSAAAFGPAPRGGTADESSCSPPPSSGSRTSTPCTRPRRPPCDWPHRACRSCA